MLLDVVRRLRLKIPDKCRSLMPSSEGNPERETKSEGSGRRGRRRSRSHRSTETETPRKRQQSKVHKRRSEQVADGFSMAATVVLALAPIYAAWDYGSVQIWPQWLLACWIGVAGLLTIPVMVIQWRISRVRFFVPFAALILICMCGYLQSLQLPSFLVGVASPGVSNAYQQWVPASLVTEAISTDNNVLNGLAKPSSPASLDAGLTRNALIMPIVFLVTMFIAAFTIRSQNTIMTFLVVTMISGGIFAFTGIADAIRPESPGLENQDLITPEAAGAPFGPFVNRNNAAGYLGVCLAACVGMLVFVVLRRREKTVVDQRYAVAPDQWWQRPVYAIQAQLRDMDAAAMTVLTVIILIIGGIAISGSRGGFLGIISGTCAAALLTGQRGTGLAKSLSIVLVATGTAGLLGLVGMVDAVSERLETIWASDGKRDGRLDHWGDGLTAAWHYFPGGSGLGTYRYAYLPFQESSDGSWFINADGMHVEWLVEGGLWLLPLLLILFVMIVFDITSLAKLKKAPHITAIIAMGWFAIGAVLVSQSFDFGILLPPMYITLAMMMGAIVGASDRFANQLERAEKKKADQALLATGATIPDAPKSDAPKPLKTTTLNAPQQPAPTEHSVPKIASDRQSVLEVAAQVITQKTGNRRDYKTQLVALIAISGLASVLLLLAIRQAYHSAVGQSVVVDMNSPPALDQLTQADDHLEVTGQLIEWNDDVVVLPQRLPDEVTPEFFRKAAAVTGRRAAYFLATAEQQKASEPVDVDAAELLFEGQSMASLTLARQHALAALLKSPLSPEARYRLIQLDFVEPESIAATPELINQFSTLRSRNDRVLINVARLALVYPGSQLSSEILHNVLEISPQSIGAVWPILSADNNMERAMAGIPDEPAIMVQLLESFPQMEPAWRSALLQRSVDLVNATVSSRRTVDQHVTAGRLAMQIRDWETAARSFEAAVELDAATIDYRYRWALALERAGNYQAAIEQINRCQLREPTNKIYQNKERELMDRMRKR